METNINIKYHYESRRTWMIEDGWLDNTGDWYEVPRNIDDAILENSDSITLYDCEVTKDLFKLPNLRRLQINRPLGGVPNWVAQITSLEELVIQEIGDIQEFVNLLPSMRNLKKLHLLVLIFQHYLIPFRHLPS